MNHRRLLLLSSSMVYGQDYLGHGADEILALLGHNVSHVLFVPYAKVAWDDYTQKVRTCFEKWGISITGVHEAAEPGIALENAEALFIGGGNTFLLLHDLYKNELMEPIRNRVRGGMPYIGTSAGSNVAGPTIQTTNDMPIIYPPTFSALALVSFNINPHYLEPGPSSQHMGETRMVRIREFHEHNPQPVVGIRESSMLRVDNSSIKLIGPQPAKVFRAGKKPLEISPGTALDFLEQ
ncbi:dipeptidase PepE [candidate division CSSED10-310 bacterium]|uniref:Dipeptidase PepE n=1 Tax=candidate division CSSED10-310 bacterium TaxID=2855610 RepID=A0ABV6Z294_UNCC1